MTLVSHALLAKRWSQRSLRSTLSRDPISAADLSLYSFANVTSARLSDGEAGLRGAESSLARGVRRLWESVGLRHLLPLAILLVYSLVGAGIFYAVESGPGLRERDRIEGDINASRRQMEERVWEIRVERNLSMAQIRRFTSEAIEWYEAKLERRESWRRRILDFRSALFYCATIYTTIGYGTLCPATTAGQVLTMIYATLGIPLVFIILNGFGSAIARLLIRALRFRPRAFVEQLRVSCWTFVRRRMGKAEPLHEEVEEEEEDVTDHRSSELHLIPVPLVLGITVAWMLFCSYIFQYWETEWSYFTSFYFFFVSLTTIGLGDTAPTRTGDLLANFWLVLLGLSLVSMCIQWREEEEEAWALQVAQAKAEWLTEELLLEELKAEAEARLEEELSVAGTLPGTAAPSVATDPHGHTPWATALLTRNRRERLHQRLHQRLNVKTTAVQTEEADDAEVPCTKIGVAKVLLNGNATESAVESWHTIAELRAANAALETRLKEALARPASSPTPPPVPPRPPPHRSLNLFSGASEIPYREIRGGPVSTELGREVLGQLSARIAACRSLAAPLPPPAHTACPSLPLDFSHSIPRS